MRAPASRGPWQSIWLEDGLRVGGSATARELGGADGQLKLSSNHQKWWLARRCLLLEYGTRGLKAGTLDSVALEVRAGERLATAA